MPRSWRECCDDIIVWACGSFDRICGNNENGEDNGRYTGEELQGDWFPPTSNDTRLIDIEEGRVGTGGVDNEGNVRGVRREGMTENRCSDPKIIEVNSPTSETNAIRVEGASVERRSPIDWREDIDV